MVQWSVNISLIMNNMYKKEVLCEREYGIVLCKSGYMKEEGCVRGGALFFLLNEAPKNIIERERKRNQDATSVTKAIVIVESNVSVSV